MCPQTVGLVQKACEEKDILTTTISIIDEITEMLKVKRYFSVPYSLGYPLGDIDNYSNQKEVCKSALNLISK